MRKIKIAPSILAADPTRLGEEVKKIEKAGAEYVHIDIMDGHFVPNLAYSPDTVKGLRPLSNLIFDVHLMIEEPKKYIEAFVKAGADIITVHQEVTENLTEMAEFIHSFGVKAGISVKPGTPIETLGDEISEYDLVLIMTVEPGFGGQSYIEAMNDKITKAREMIDKTGKLPDSINMLFEKKTIDLFESKGVIESYTEYDKYILIKLSKDFMKYKGIGIPIFDLACKVSNTISLKFQHDRIECHIKKLDKWIYIASKFVSGLNTLKEQYEKGVL